MAGVDVGQRPARRLRAIVARRGVELLFNIDDGGAASEGHRAENGVRVREARCRPGRGFERRVPIGCERAHIAQVRKPGERVRPFGHQRVYDELIGVDMAGGSVQLIEELHVADGHDEGVAEAVIGCVGGVRAVGGDRAVDDDVVVVRIGLIRRAIGVQPQRLVFENPAFAQVGRNRRNDGLLLVARAVVEEALDPPCIRPHEGKIVGLHRIITLGGLHLTADAIIRVRRAKRRRVDRRKDARGVVPISP